jgi:CheY-like chemotaxis protein/signal transduction histidine kinase
VIERVDTAASVREVLCTQHESSVLDVDLRSWARRPEWLAQVLTEAAESGKPRLLELETEAALLSSDVASARALGFESVVVAPLLARGRLFGMLTCASQTARRYGRTHLDVFADLGHRIALALDNAELYASAQQTRRDCDALCRALSSELQQPLAALTEMATQSVERSESRHERSLAETFLHETRRIEAQLQALKEFAGCAAGKLQLDIREVELAQRARARVESHPHTNLLRLRLDPELSDFRVFADAERLEQAFDAILQVATSHAAPGSSVEVVLSRPFEEEAELQLVVSCTGSCLSAQQLADLGQLTSYDYDTTESVTEETPAFGLCLARALIEAQGGRFWVQTQRNAGNSFHIALPVPAVHTRDTTDEPSPNAVILLVDSDLAFRRELQEILSERGYLVETADNGLQAWQYLLAHAPPALILFDLVLPAMDGWELHAAIKSHAALQVVPTVVVSGLDRYRIEASLPDAHSYIEKPIRSAQLFEVVQRHVATPARPRTLSVRPSSFC